MFRSLVLFFSFLLWLRFSELDSSVPLSDSGTRSILCFVWKKMCKISYSGMVQSSVCKVQVWFVLYFLSRACDQSSVCKVQVWFVLCFFFVANCNSYFFLLVEQCLQLTKQGSN
jgi:hypothetical protein